ncbi:MAG: tRNA lysidine(34) synthetase TilS [Sandaracinaceae bacterium]
MIAARVQRTIDARGLVPEGATVLVGCSGGPDSAALLHVLSVIGPPRGWSLHAASVDHGLRDDAAEDVEVARRQATRAGVPFNALRVSVVGGGSVQAKARDARYAALSAEAVRVGASRVAVGHTRDDQAETVLARMLRGSGLRGMSGVAPGREDGVIRPLIDCRRLEVHAYARAQGLETCRDPSNKDPRFERVRLRALLPLLEVESPRLVDHLADLADECRETAGWIAQRADEVGLGAARELERSRLEGIAGPVRKAALAGWVLALTGVPARRAHIESLEHALRVERGHVLLGGGWEVTCGPRWRARRSSSPAGRSASTDASAIPENGGGALLVDETRRPDVDE